MLFNSFDFGIFLPVVFVLYSLLGSSRLKAQNLLILAASYFFYGVWDYRFLLIIIISSLVDFYAGIALSKTKNSFRRKGILYSSLFWNLGVLFVFKYYNFFIDNFKTLFHIPPDEFNTLDIIVPVGLSFYTFQTISYTIDVYKKKVQPSTNMLQFLCFVAFFPQLVAGPIERASKLLPQFKNKRFFDYAKAKDGLRLILWGLFKKVVVADSLAIAVAAIYGHPEHFSSLEILYASLLFFFQMYCDFSGYSDIAIGTAKLFGFDLSINFRLPYLVRNVSSFWNRWHITLSKWFRDYVYLPYLLPRKRGYYQKCIALLLTMTLMGIWHGAKWTFVLFGISQALILAFEIIPITSTGKHKDIRHFLYTHPFLGRLYFFFNLSIAMIFFRSEHIGTAWQMVKGLFTHFEGIWDFDLIIGWKIGVLVILLTIELLTRNKQHPLKDIEKRFNTPIRWLIYYALIFLIIRYGGAQEEFIYFQF